MTKPNAKNERIKRLYVDFLRHADGKSAATIRQIEKALLRYETFTGFADFKTFDQRHAKAFKADLANRELAKATILSTVTALKRFFGWLRCQSGYKRQFDATDIEYLSLSDKDIRAAKAPAHRDFPTLGQVDRVVSLMPSETDIEKRDRALMSFAALTGIRDGALISLRTKHVDVQRKLVIQDPNEVATKSGKRIDTYFFPVGDDFEAIVLDWCRYLVEQLKFRSDDPLFPKTSMGHDDDDCFIADGLTREFWSNAGPVRKIFKAAFKRAGLPNFSPHSFRNTLVQEAYRRKLAPDQLKAWSQNFGHDSVLTTLTSYGHIDVQQQGILIRNATGSEDDQPVTRKDMERFLKKLNAK